MKAIISGGGSGGHIFPAIAIANALKQRFPEIEILFIGAKGKMEMEKVPAAGYNIVGLPIAGLQRKLSLRNLLVPFKLLNSFYKARSIIKKFKPQIVIGVGGYASAPTLRMANSLGISTLIQEQNSYPGVTNKILAKKTSKICVAYSGMERFFQKDKIVFTGNPVRQDIVQLNVSKEDIFQYFGVDVNQTVLLVIGGSLGARTINESIHANLQYFKDKGLQVIWQTGKWYYQTALTAVKDAQAGNVKVFEFISRMDLAYSAADFIVSRAGAIAISELCLIGKPMILIPSPNVSEDHQTKNASALVEKDAAILVRDAEAKERLRPVFEKLLNDPDQQKTLSGNSKKLGIPNAADLIVDEIIKLISDPSQA